MFSEISVNAGSAAESNEELQLSEKKIEMHDEYIEELLNAEWQKNTDLRKNLYTNGAQSTFGDLPNFASAFTADPNNLPVLCIDEGCAGHGTHMAGSGCMISEDKLISELKAAGITEFTTHENCGAWGLAHPEITDPKEKEAAVISWGESIAQKLGVPYKYIPAEEMDRPADFHNAFFAIYDLTGKFNSKTVTGMPSGFITSPKYFSSAKADLELAVKIATGDHGFGKRFTAENPFVLIGIIPGTEETGVSKEQIRADLEGIQQKFEQELVKIDFIEVPKTI